MSNNMTDFDDFEDAFAKQVYNDAYKDAFEQGRLDGQQEGEKEGSLLGAKIGSEIGYYRGYTKTWIEIMKSQTKETKIQEDPKSKRILNKLEEVLQLVDSFPTTNETNCEEKLTDIRVKFKNLKHFNI